MKVKRLCLAILIFFMLFSWALPCAGAEGNAPAEQPSPLRFRPDGTFTVLILSDAQDTQFVSPYLRNAISNILYNYSVDLVVLLGNQLDGANPVLRLGYGYNNVCTAIDRLLGPISDANIPFAVAFGSADYEAPAAVSLQAKQYRSYQNCVAVAENGACGIPVYTSDGETKAMHLYLFDTGFTDEEGRTGAASPEQVDWYLAESESLRGENDYQSIPSVALMHAPVKEIYGLFDEVPSGTADAFSGSGSAAGRYYSTVSDRILAGEVREAPVTSDANNGLFDAFTRQKDVFLAVSGQEHLNSFIGSLHGIDLAAAPGSTYTAYGEKADRGVRLFRFFEHNVQDYETLHVRFSDYDDGGGAETLRYYLLTSTGIRNTTKVGLIALVLLLVMLVLVILILRQNARQKQEDVVDEDRQLEEPEDPYL